MSIFKDNQKNHFCSLHKSNNADKRKEGYLNNSKLSSLINFSKIPPLKENFIFRKGNESGHRISYPSN